MPKFIDTTIEGVVIIEPNVFGDERGYFFESYNMEAFNDAIGSVNFVQDNESKSYYGVLRGLHFQLPPFAQAKLVRVVQGEVLDVVVDIRRNSPTFGQHLSLPLSETNKTHVFIPRGLAHGFVVLSESAIFQYKVDNIYSAECERGIIYHDPQLKIDWGLPKDHIKVSQKDAGLPLLNDLDH